MTDADTDAINDKLYEYYKQFPGPAMCPTQFDYSNCNDDERWIVRLLDNPMTTSLFFQKLFSVVDAQNINLKKENEDIKGAQEQNQILTRLWTKLQNPGVIEKTTLDDFLGTSGQPPQQQQQLQQPQQQQLQQPPQQLQQLQQQQPPQPPQSNGFFGKWFGTGGALDLAKMNSTPKPAGCPVYAKKLDFNECSDENAIIDFLLNDARISQFIMKYDKSNTMHENNELKIENENLKRSYPNWNQLMKDNITLAFNINKAHRIAGTRSPLIGDWKMNQDYRLPAFKIRPDYDYADQGGKKTRKITRKKTTKFKIYRRNYRKNRKTRKTSTTR